MSEMDNNESREELFSKGVRAGKRTYFFDVRSTRGNDFYLSITESKRKFSTNENEKPFFEKHKIFLYREDFDKFLDGMQEALDYIRENAPPLEPRVYNHRADDVPNNHDNNNTTTGDLSFEDLK